MTEIITSNNDEEKSHSPEQSKNNITSLNEENVTINELSLPIKPLIDTQRSATDSESDEENAKDLMLKKMSMVQVNHSVKQSPMKENEESESDSDDAMSNHELMAKKLRLFTQASLTPSSNPSIQSKPEQRLASADSSSESDSDQNTQLLLQKKLQVGFSNWD